MADGGRSGPVLRGRRSGSAVSRIATIRALVESGLYYLTEHADAEAQADGLDIYDVEAVVAAGRVRWVSFCA